jgi:hypothetical protein
MRKYYTLIQKFHDDAGNRDLTEFLHSNEIEYKISADTATELREFGLRQGSPDDFYKKYVVLIDEHELSAIQLAVGGVILIKNRSSVNRLNWIRSFFPWLLK